MSKRVIFILVSAAAFALAAGLYLGLARRSGPAGLVQGSAAGRPYVPIQDGKTIDFSTGGPVVRQTADDQAAMEKALQEMDAAAKSVTFEPLAAAQPARK